MANPAKRLPNNVDGDFFVDSTCIDCDTCRQIAPETFADAGRFSFVHTQPRAEDAMRNATRALLACPTGSIGTAGRNLAKIVMPDFPLPLEDGVHYNGFNSPKSYGGHSYFVRHSDGNWLIDSPRFLPHLVKRFEEWGGVKYIFLTHRDDVAEAESYAKRFGATRIIHEADLSAQPGAEIIPHGNEPRRFGDDFLAVPTPGHTEGHMVLLYKNRFLFTGDHLWWSRERRSLSCSSDYCWYSFAEQTRSMEKLRAFRFEWVLPGHGERIKLDFETMNRELVALVERMKSR